MMLIFARVLGIRNLQFSIWCNSVKCVYREYHFAGTGRIIHRCFRNGYRLLCYDSFNHLWQCSRRLFYSQQESYDHDPWTSLVRYR